MSETSRTVAKIKIGGQWFVRGNRSPSWFAYASRIDGSMSGICEKIPDDVWPILDAFDKSLADKKGVMSNTPRTDSMQAKLSDKIDDTKAFLLAGAAQIERELIKSLADLKRLKQYTGTEAQACPLCTYDDGILLEVCGFHKLIEVAWFQRDRAEADLEAMRKERDDFQKQLINGTDKDKP